MRSCGKLLVSLALVGVGAFIFKDREKLSHSALSTFELTIVIKKSIDSKLARYFLCQQKEIEWR